MFENNYSNSNTYRQLKYEENNDTSQLFYMEFDSWRLQSCEHSIPKSMQN